MTKSKKNLKYSPLFFVKLSSILNSIKRIALLLSLSFMLGFSNAMKGELRMINDNKPKIELNEVLSDDEDDISDRG